MTSSAVASTPAILLLDSLRGLEAAAPEAEEQSEGVVLLDERYYEYSDTLTYTYAIHRVVKITTSSGRDTYGNASISYDGSRESLASCRALTVKPDGQVHEVREDQYVSQDSEATEFSDRQTIAWPFVHVDSGDIVEYLAIVSGVSRRKEDLFSTLVCNEPDPVGLQRVILRCPMSWPILEDISPRVVRTQVEIGGDIIRTWEVRDVMPVHSESLAPTRKQRSEWIRFGYDKPWSNEARWYSDIISPKIETTPRVKELAKALTAGAKSREGKIESLFRFVAREIRYVAITLGEGELEPHMTSAIIDAKYGDCKDKSVLLLSLLRAVGIEAGAAAITATDTAWFNPMMPDISQFDHMIVYIADDSVIFLDPTCERCRWNELSIDYKQQPVLLLDSNLSEPLAWTPRSNSLENGWQRDIRLVVDTAGGVDISVVLRGRGALSEYYNYELPYLDSIETREWVHEMTMQGLWATLSDHEYEVKNSPDSGFVFTVLSRYRNDSIFTRNSLNLTLPLFMDPIFWAVTRPDTVGRTLDIQYSVPKTLTTRMLIVHGSQWEVQNTRISWENDTTWYHASSTVNQWEDSSEITTVFEFPACRIPLSEYSAFLRSLDMLKNRLTYQGPNYRRKPDHALIARLEAELKRSPGSVPVLAALAEAYLGRDYGGLGCNGRERRAKAREYLERARESDPANETPVVFLASLLIIDELHADADSLISSHAQAHGRSLMTDGLKAVTAQKLGRYTELLELMKRTSSTPSVVTRGALAEAYALAGDRVGVESQISLMQTFGDDPDAIRLTRLKAAMHLREWHVAESLTVSMEDLPEEDRFITLGNIADHSGDPHVAARYVAAALAQNPDHPQLSNNYAWALAQCDSILDVALSSAEHASKLEGACAWSARNTRAYVLLKMGMIDEARREFEACLAPQDTKSRTINYYCLGECERLSGNPAGAREYYEMAIRYSGDPIFESLAKEALSKEQ